MSEPSEVHKLLAEGLNSEMNRFWTRFNIFSAVQVVAVVGLSINSDALPAKSDITWWASILILGWSVTGLMSNLRGFDLIRGLVKTILDFEKSLPSNQQYVTPVLNRAFFPRFITTYACILFSLFCVIFWSLFFINYS